MKPFLFIIIINIIVAAVTQCTVLIEFNEFKEFKRLFLFSVKSKKDFTSVVVTL